MKFTALAITLAALGNSVTAQHHHGHRHVKRSPDEVAVPVTTVYAYELNGTPIPAADVCHGIENGKLKWKDGDAPQGACGPALSPTSTSAAATTSSDGNGAQFFQQESSTAPTPTTTSSTTSNEPEPTSSEEPTPSSTPDSQPSYQGGQGVDSDFPDGELSCDTFPEEYGPVPADWLEMNGWIGIQSITISGGAVSNIDTGIAGSKCDEGCMCSYACPPGYQKSQWPSIQGATGQSVGGIECKNGKLHLTNPDLSKKLCIPGTGNVYAKNTLNEVVSICRTDYPGTESETVPVAVQPGETQPLTCPNANSYFKWKGMSTSAQYYVNPKGVEPYEGCRWGEPGTPIGNYAPVNLGVGTKDGATWISIMANKPTTDAILDFDIEIVGDDLGGSCKYSNGVYTSGIGSNGDGCTVQVKSGSATYVFK